MTTTTMALDDPERELLRLLAKGLTHDTSFGPPAQDSDPRTELDRALDLRPDLVEPLRAVLRGVGDDPAGALVRLPAQDPAGWAALVACVFGGALMRSDVRHAIGYPGQEGRIVRAEDFTRWAEAGLLDPVLERGPIWRRPPTDAWPTPPALAQ